jgi:ADP-heptose:LPS heptosyltransferase
MSRVLVIRLGALGDFVQSFGPFAAIRAHRPQARITLLTTPPFAELGRRAPWFDAVLIDTRPSAWNLPGLLRLARSLRGFDFVYDVQTSSRSSRYFWLAGRPPWSGIAAGCSHPHANPRRDFMHTRERQREQLEMAGVEAFAAPDLAWLTRVSDRAQGDGIRAALPGAPYAILVPGAAPHRPAKRWPYFPALAGQLEARGLVPVVLGSPAERPLADAIRQHAPSAIDLTGRTSIADLAVVAASADLAVGNDTGPMHVAAGVGCPSVVLFAAVSDPDLTAPRYPDGGWPTILRAADLADLPPDRVAAALP